jgi:hypothetical protein
MWLVIGAPIFMAIMLLIPDAAIDRRVSGQDRSTQVGARHEIEARESHTPAVEITPAPSPRT